jgi:hypothetical protein
MVAVVTCAKAGVPASKVVASKAAASARRAVLNVPDPVMIGFLFYAAALPPI